MFVTSRSAQPLPLQLRFNGPNTVRVARLNNDSIDRADPYDPDDVPVPLNPTTEPGMTVTFTVFDETGNGRTTPFADYDSVPLIYTAPVGDEPACWKKDFDATDQVPVGQYYGEIVVTVPGKSPAPIRTVVTVFL